MGILKMNCPNCFKRTEVVKIGANWIECLECEAQYLVVKEIEA